MSKIISIHKTKKKKRFTRSLEYDLVASLTFQQYASKEGPDYIALLSIPLSERIPSFIHEYGLLRMHRLMRTMLIEYLHSIPISKRKQLTDLKISVITCDLILVAQEDQLSLEDLVIFFEFSRKGPYGAFQSELTHSSIMERIQTFRTERHNVFTLLKEKKNAEMRVIGPSERISPEPTLIKHLFEQGKVVPFKKIS